MCVHCLSCSERSDNCSHVRRKFCNWSRYPRYLHFAEQKSMHEEYSDGSWRHGGAALATLQHKMGQMEERMDGQAEQLRKILKILNRGS